MSKIRSAIADTITIVTGLVTTASVVASWFAGPPPETESIAGATGVSIIAVAILTAFFFLAQLRAFKLLGKMDDDVTAMALSFVAVIFSVALFAGAEIILLTALLPPLTGFELIIVVILPSFVLMLVSLGFAILTIAA